MTSGRTDARPAPPREAPLPVGALAALVGTAAVGLGGGLALGAAGATSGLVAAVAAVGVAGAVGGVLYRPLWAVALVFASPAVGDRPLPGAPLGLQVVHVVCVFALAVVGLSVLSGGLLGGVRRMAVRLPLLCGAGLVATAFASTLASVDPARSVKVAATFAVGLLLVLAVLVVARGHGEHRVLLGAAVLGSMVVTVPVLGGAGALDAAYGGAVVENRAESTFADPNALGSYAALVLLLAAGWFFGADGRIERIAAAAGGATAAAALTLTLSRGAWIGAAAGLAVFATAHPPARAPLAWLGLAGATAAVAVLALPVIGVAPRTGPVQVVADRVAAIADRSANPYDVRPITWQEAIRQFAAEPALGNGPGAFSVLSAESGSELQFYPRRHAHNAVLTTAAEMGVAGLLAGLGMVGTLALTVQAQFRRLRRARGTRPDTGGRERAVLAGGAAALVALSVHLLVDYPLRNPVLMVTVWAVAGLVLAAVAAPTGTRRTGALTTYAASPR